MATKGNAATAVEGFYNAYRAAYDTKSFGAELYAALIAAEASMVATPAQCVDDMLLKLKVATEQGTGSTIYPALVESVVRDLERMNAPGAIAIAA